MISSCTCLTVKNSKGASNSIFFSNLCIMAMQTVCGTDIETAIAFLAKGEVVAIPTETVYGLAANALNADAVIKIYKAKNRPAFNPLIVHTHSWEQAQQYIKSAPSQATLLARHFWPGPLTLLLPRNDFIPDIVTAGSDKVAIRVPQHPLTLALLQKLDFPLAAPSANPSGYVSPTTALHVYEGLNGKIPYILDGGPCSVGLESTIVGWDDDDQPVVYRLGGISPGQLEEVLGQKVEVRKSVVELPATPGQLKSHYAPHTPLLMGKPEDYIPQYPGKKIAVITLGAQPLKTNVAYHFPLSTTGLLDEAAKNLFRILREADQCGADIIIAEEMPHEGLGPAINDRLKRAQFIYK